MFEPIPELLHATDLITEAGDQLMKGQRARAAESLAAADIPDLLEHFTLATTPSTWHEPPPKPSRSPLPEDLQPPRVTPRIAQLRELNARDGYRCRFCSIRVIDKDVFQKLRSLLPQALRWGRCNADQHAAFLCLRASHDHVVPRCHGGANTMNNYVTACQICQYARGDWLIEDVGVSDPRLRSPILDEWDGLRRILTLG